MKKISIEIKEVDDILKLNKLIEKSKYDELNVDVGIGDSHMVDGRSILGLMNVFGQNMTMLVYGDTELEDAFLIELAGIVKIQSAINTKS